MNPINIFLASSNELKEDRDQFEIFIRQENDILVPRGIHLNLTIWEDFIDAVSATRLQDEYNKKIEQADIFIMLFFTKVGMYTSEEFDKALKGFKEAGKPLIYTYFKNAVVKLGSLNPKDVNSVWDFQNKLRLLGHFQTEYEHTSDFLLHFKKQLDKLFAEGKLKMPSLTGVPGIPKCLSAGEPSVPPGFIGRKDEIDAVSGLVTKHRHVLVSAEGGMGKTTFAAKFLADNWEHYAHYAWLFCENGILAQILSLAGTLQVDISRYTETEAQLMAIKTALQNLPGPNLLILDNANSPEQIADFQKLFGGLQWDILFTSRCQQVLPKNQEFVLPPLSLSDARTLFKANHDEGSPEFDDLLDKFLAAVGYNTLMIELFSKNLHELSALGETLKQGLEEFKQKGFFLGAKSFEIQTGWTGNTHKQAATTDQVLELLYDISSLEESDRHLLVNLALFPAENQPLEILIEALTPDDKYLFARQLRSLSQKGWLISDASSYRMNPVIQNIIIVKNRERLLTDAEILVQNLSHKLKFSRGFLVNLRTLAEAKPFAEIGTSVLDFLPENDFNLGLLLANLSDYFLAIGSLLFSLKYLEKATSVFEKIDQANYGVCLERLGSIYEQRGNFNKALQFFEMNLDLRKELVDANPHNEELKNGLTVSYLNLGDIHQKQGDFNKALHFYKLRSRLSKELADANPLNEMLKEGLAISYERLGDIYQQQGDFNKALQFFEMNLCLRKELVDAHSHSEALKNGLAISYSKLGDIYQQQGDFNKALQFFELRSELGKELADANPHSEALKNGLAISYERLGSIYQQQGDFNKALQFFELRAQLGKELADANPHSEALKNGLAISYSKLGDIYRQQGDFNKALRFFELQTDLFKELADANPHSEALKNGLAVSYSKLGDIYQQQGDFNKALQFYELRSKLGKELADANPHSEALKNGLAISYSKLGSIYQQQGDFTKALQFFELQTALFKELADTNPQSETLKNGLAISYVKLGEIYQQQEDFNKALHFFELNMDLTKELADTNPHSEALKNGLAISYDKIGEIYQQREDFNKALKFFELQTTLFKELADSNPQSEALKNGLAISYSKLGDIYQQQGNFNMALQFFEYRSQLGKELADANPHSVWLSNGLAVSYAKLGSLYEEIKEPEKANQYFIKAEKIWIDLVQKAPGILEYQNNLDRVKEKLA